MAASQQTLLASKFKNTHLVICEDDLLFNNRWFQQPDRYKFVNIDEHVLLRSDQIFENLSKFNDLKCVKISRITLGQLRQFAQVPCLSHVEVDVLLAYYESSPSFEPISLPKLQRLRIDKFDEKSQITVTFDTSELKALYLGTK